MPLFSLLLRVVLCVSLIANGAGYAQASARMQFEHAAHAPPVVAAHVGTVASAETADVPPCHRHATKTTPVASMHAGHAMAQADMSPIGKATPATPAGKKPAPDCCKGKTCKCACAHASCAAISASTMQAVGSLDVRIAVLTIDHPQPRLPHLIRPPIG